MTQWLIVLTWLIPAVWLAYTLKTWWAAQQQFSQLDADVKAFYLLVAPPLAFALDVLILTDRLLYRPKISRNSTYRMTISVAALWASCSLWTVGVLADADEIKRAERSLEHAQTSLKREKDFQPYLSASETSAIQYREVGKGPVKLEADLPSDP